MSRILWLIAGIVIGFVGAHFANRTRVGRRVFNTIDQGAREFQNAVVSGYRSREAEFGSTIRDVEHALDGVKNNSSLPE